MNQSEKLSFTGFLQDIRQVVVSPARRFAVIQERGAAWGSLLLLILPSYLAFYYFGGVYFDHDPFPGYSFIPPMVVAVGFVYAKLYLIHLVARGFLGKGRSDPEHGRFSQLETVLGYSGVPAILAGLCAISFFLMVPQALGYAILNFHAAAVSALVAIGVVLSIWRLILAVLALRSVYPMRDLKLIGAFIFGSILTAAPAVGTLLIAAPASVDFAYVQPVLSSRFLRLVASDPTSNISAESKISIHVDRLVYLLKSPQRFDLVLFTPRHPRPAKNAQETITTGMGAFFSWEAADHLVGRLVGCPGDSVELVKGQLYVNGQAWDEPYLLPQFRSTCDLPPIKLGPAEYLALPENRNLIDSLKDELVVERNQILGREIVSRWPLGWWSFQPTVFRHATPK